MKANCLERPLVCCSLRVIGLGIGLLALTACGLFLSEDAQLKRALEAQQKGDLRAASIDLKNLLGKHPNNREARFALGVVELDSGDAAAAAHDLERARTDGVVIERVTEPLARAYAVQRQFDKALQLIDAQTAAASKDGKANDKDSARYERLRGEILLATRDFPGARSAFEAVLNTAPNDVRAILGLASAVEAIEGNTNALKIIDRALEVAPDDVNVLLARGTMLMQMRQTNDAAAMFQKAAEIATRPAQKAQLLASLSGLAQSQLVLGQVEPALKTTARMQELAPNSPVTRYAHAYALAQNGELDKARELLEQNISQAEDVRSKLLLGAVNLSQGRYAQAEMQLSAVVAVAPNNNEARQLLAESRLRQAKPADALETLLPSIEKNTNASANLIALAAQASFAAGKTKEGVELLKRNVTQHPQDEKPKLDLAAGYLAAGQADQALAILDATSDKSSKTSGKDDHNEAAPKTQETETQLVRREYLNVLARVQKGDSSGAVAHATRVAQDHPEDATLQSLASAVLMAQRQFAKARPYAEAVVHLRPDDAAGYTNLGRLDILEGNVDAAKNSFQTALQKQPGDAVATTALALLELSKQHNDAALEILSESRKHNAKNIEPRLLETQILLSRGKLDDAEKLARETVTMANDNAFALAALGRVLSSQGRHGEAIQTFERAVHAQPKNVPILYQLAAAQRLSGHGDDALQTAREVLKLNQHYIPAIQMEGLLSVGKGDLATVNRDAEELLKSAPDQAATHELIALLRNAQKRYAEAAAAFQKAGELSPRPEFAISEFQMRTQGKLPAPEAPLEKFLATNPAEPTTRTVLAQAQQARGDRAAAAQSYQLVLTNAPKSPVALNNLAWMHFEDRNPDAIDLAHRAYTAAPAAIQVADTYAWILVNTGKVNEGLKVFDTMFGANNRNAMQTSAPEIRAHYAIALSRGGRRSEAKTIAKELTANNASDLSKDAQAQLADLIKS